jgi:hypothetical protein
MILTLLLVFLDQQLGQLYELMQAAQKRNRDESDS